MGALKNIFSLSNSQMDTFKECPKKYWFARYGSWNGWDETSPERTKEIYRLKNLSSIYLWTGDRVHKKIKEILTTWVDTGVMLPEETMVAEFLDTLRNEFKQSRAHPPGAPFRKGFLKLIEHDDPDRAVTDQKVKEVVDRAAKALRGFYKSDVLRLLGDLKPEERQAALLRKDDKLETANVVVDGRNVPVYVTLDVLVVFNNWYFIVDWKTGKPEDKHEAQLGLYALFVTENLKGDPNRISYMPVYLAYTPEETAYMDTNAKHLRDARARVETVAREIFSRMENPDEGVALEEKFPPKPSKFGCGWCEYARLCEAAYNKKTQACVGAQVSVT